MSPQDVKEEVTNRNFVLEFSFALWALGIFTLLWREDIQHYMRSDLKTCGIVMLCGAVALLALGLKWLRADVYVEGRHSVKGVFTVQCWVMGCAAVLMMYGAAVGIFEGDTDPWFRKFGFTILFSGLFPLAGCSAWSSIQAWQRSVAPPDTGK